MTVGIDAQALCFVNRWTDCHGSGIMDEPLGTGRRVAINQPERFGRIVLMQMRHALSFEGNRCDLAGSLAKAKLNVSATWLARAGMQAVGQTATNFIDAPSETISLRPGCLRGEFQAPVF